MLCFASKDGHGALVISNQLKEILCGDMAYYLVVTTYNHILIIAGFFL